jgi:hypothetical protein
VLSILIVPKPNLTNIVKSVIFFKSHFLSLSNTPLLSLIKKRITDSVPKIGRWPFQNSLWSRTTISKYNHRRAILCRHFYYKWMTENNPDDLHRLTAILYRPSAEPTLEDKRIPFLI